MVTNARVTSLQYTPLIRLTETPSSSIQTEVEQRKPFSMANTNIFAPFQKHVRSKLAPGDKKRNSGNEGVDTSDDETVQTNLAKVK